MEFRYVRITVLLVALQDTALVSKGWRQLAFTFRPEVRVTTVGVT